MEEQANTASMHPHEDKHWLPATVWVAQHAAREAQTSGVQLEGLQRCAACAADIKISQKSKCSKCKMVSSSCLAKVLYVKNLTE